MTHQVFEDNIARSATFGRRKVTPRACIADSKKHLRAFLTDVLEDLGFVTSECAKADELGMILDTQLPDLIVLGLSVDGIEAGKILEVLVCREVGGKVLALGARGGAAARPSPSAPASRSSSRRCGKLARKTASQCCRRSPRRSPPGRCASESLCFSPTNQHPAPPSTCPRHCTPAGSNYGTSRRSMPAHWFAAVPKRWCGCGIQPGAWSRQPILSPKTTIRISCVCRIS